VQQLTSGPWVRSCRARMLPAAFATEAGTFMLRLASRMPGSLGLAGLSNGFENLGGTTRIRTVRGTGTRITATIPIIAWERRRVV
jgi:hypothetical protein